MSRTLVKTFNFGLRNLIINGDMQISQRNTSAIPTGGFQYLLDRHVGWVTNPGSVTGETMTQSSLPALFPGESSQTLGRAFRMFGTMTALDASFNRMQRIEASVLRDEVKALTTVSMGIWIWSNNFQNASIQALQPTTGSPDNWASSAVIESAVVTLNESAWTFVKLENITLANDHGLEFRISCINPAATVFTDTYATEMKCNSGPVVERFSLRGRDASDEINICQRYYQKLTVRARAALQSGTNEYPITFIEKRVNPSVSFSPAGPTAAVITRNSIAMSTTLSATGNVLIELDSEL